MGDHKNTIIAIVLSLIVVVGWQYFVGYPQMEKQREQALLKQQEQAQTQPGATQPNAAQPGATPGAGHRRRHAAAGARHRRARGRDRIARRGDCRFAAHRHRHADAARQHRSQGRAHRRSVARALSRDHRSELAGHRAVLAVGRAGRVLRRVRLGGRRRHHRGDARTGHGVEAGRLGRARHRSSGDADLRQRRGLDLPPHHRGRRPLSVHPQGPGGEQGRRSRSRCFPMRWSRATARRRCWAITFCTRA